MLTVKKLFFLILILILVNKTAIGQNDLPLISNRSVSLENISEPYSISLNQSISGVNAEKRPAGALLRSFVLPGWGHYYVDKNSWSRGQAHLLADILLIGSYFGLTVHAQTFARQHAGINLKGRGRDYLLNVAEFSSIQAYNDFQERSRNWDQIYEVNANNAWNWDSDTNRLSFLKLDNRVQNNRQQLPAIISLMVVNRIISGVTAYSKATQFNDGNSITSITVSVPEFNAGKGLQANIKVSF
jgi:hypothetical protein